MQSKYTNITIFMSLNDSVRPNVYDCYWTLFISFVLQLSTDHYLQDSKKNERTARSYSRKGPGYEVLVAYTNWANPIYHNGEITTNKINLLNKSYMKMAHRL